MATRPKRPCRHPGCPTLTTDGYCEQHQQDRAQYDRDRGSAAQRGYDRHWQRHREAYLKAHPLCQRCKDKGRIEAAKVVHHLDPVSQGHAVLADEDRLMPLCRACHEVLEGRRADTPG